MVLFFTSHFHQTPNKYLVKPFKLLLKPLLTELAECFLKEYLQYFYDIFLSNIEIKNHFKFEQYYNSRFNEKIINFFLKSIEIYQTYFIYNCLYLYISTPRTKKSTAPGAGRRLAQLKISDEK